MFRAAHDGNAYRSVFGACLESGRCQIWVYQRVDLLAELIQSMQSENDKKHQQ